MLLVETIAVAGYKRFEKRVPFIGRVEMTSLAHGMANSSSQESTKLTHHIRRRGSRGRSLSGTVGTPTGKTLLAEGTREVKVVVKRDLLFSLQTGNKTLLHPAEEEILFRGLEWARNDPSRCGPCVWTFVKKGVSLCLCDRPY
jgi:hypothetical protein